MSNTITAVHDPKKSFTYTGTNLPYEDKKSAKQTFNKDWVSSNRPYKKGYKHAKGKSAKRKLFFG